MKNRIIIAATLILGICYTARLQAQNVSIDLNELTKMREQITALTKDKDALADTIKALKQQIKATEGKLADVEKNNPLQPQIEQLKKDTTQLNADVRKALADKVTAENRLAQEKQSKDKQQIKALKDSIAKLNGNIDDMLRHQAALQQQKEQSDTQLAQAQAEQKELQAVKGEILDQLVQQINSWQQQPLNQLSLGELQRAKEQCMKYGQDSPEVAEAAKKLSPIYDDKRTLQDAQTCLNMPFDRAVVKMNRESLQEVYKRRSGESDLKDIITQLGDYPSAIDIFKGLIAEVEKTVGTQTSHKRAEPDVKNLLKDQEQVDNMTSIRTIPWLSQQLDEYLAALAKDCIHPGSVPATIKAL